MFHQLYYTMYVSFKYKFVYMAPKKTGSTSMRTLLMEHYDAILWRNYQFTHIETDVISPDWRSEGPDWKHVCHLPEHFSDFYIFSTVRNPYTLEQSRYLHDVRHKYIGPGFDHFVHRLDEGDKLPTLTRKLHQEPDYVPPPGCIKYTLNAFVRMEHLDEDFMKLPFYKPSPRFEHLHRSNATAPEYTIQLAQIVRRAYQDDFQTFGYDPRSWSSPSKIPFC